MTFLRSSNRRRATKRELVLTSEYEPVDVAIVCESTYPYLTGGLSAVVHQICEANPDARIGIVHITWDTQSPATPLYDMPAQVRWVMPVHQSMSEHRAAFQEAQLSDSGLSRHEQVRVVHRLFDAFQQHLDGSDDGLWALYDEGVNPLTRTWSLWPLLSHVEFMGLAAERFGAAGLSLTDLFWHLREFWSLAYAVTDLVLPRAAVYHAHTTGAASLLAACGARQHQTRFLLTEHNLYVRDTVNYMLGRSMAVALTEADLRTLHDYELVDIPGQRATVTPSHRAWMTWWIRTGIVAYRAAEEITYLYPDAIAEAEALGGLPEKSTIVPNGVTPEHFDDARHDFETRQARAAERPRGDRTWKLAFAARIVPIKGLMDLLEALPLLVNAGVTNWELDVMGPDGESPAYAESCRRRCTELGLDAHVRFLGRVDLRERLGGYDALLLPSHNEGQPIVVLEAMTIGLPTIGTYVGGNKQLIEDELDVVVDDREVRLGACGALVRSHDIAGLARAIDALVSGDLDFDAMSRNARARVDHYFHIDRAMGLYTERYEQPVALAPARPVVPAAPGGVLEPEALTVIA